MSRSDFRFVIWWSLVVLVFMIAGGLISGFAAMGIALLAIVAAVALVFVMYFLIMGVNILIDAIYDRWLNK